MVPPQRPRVWLPPAGLGPSSNPQIGKQAGRQINEIKAQKRRLARQIVRRIVDMVDDGLLRDAELIPDRDGIGPRFIVDLVDGYVAVVWVIVPSGRQLPVVWVEQVDLRERFEAALAELAPSEGP